MRTVRKMLDVAHGVVAQIPDDACVQRWHSGEVRSRAVAQQALEGNEWVAAIDRKLGSGERDDTVG